MKTSRTRLIKKTKRGTHQETQGQETATVATLPMLKELQTREEPGVIKKPMAQTGEDGNPQPHVKGDTPWEKHPALREGEA